MRKAKAVSGNGPKDEAEKLSRSPTLFNDASNTDNDKYLFEQYKMYIELTDRISQRRATTNTFYITANAALITIASWFKDNFGNYMFLLSGIGVIIALFWYFSIRSHRQLNSGKFKVIHEIEERLPMNLYSYEWKKLGEGKSFWIYWPLSHIENVIPFIFISLYFALSLFVYFKI